MASGEEPYVVDILEGSQHQQHCWMKSIQDQVMNYNRDEDEKQWKKFSIYRLPDFAKKMKETALTPWVVSFGPYHNGKHNLKRIEEYKQKVLVHFLHKARRPLIDFVAAIQQVLEEVRRSYDRLEDEWITDDERFVKLMIMDGCFMLEILRLDPTTGDKSYPDHDPIFSIHGALHKLPYIKRDMLMLENQLPLLVLKVLMQVEAGESRPQVTDEEINELVYKFYNNKANSQGGPLGLHVLDLYRKSMIITADKLRSPIPSKSSGVETMQTAVKLRECGVQFRKSLNNSISFDNGVLMLPIISVDDSTESTFLNLMAFEHLHVGVSHEISSYIYFMDKLVDSDQDVHLLAKKGIINNAVGSEMAVAKILNSLTEEITLDPTSNEFADVSKKVFEYSKKNVHKWRATLKHTHFSNPWSALAVVTAILLLVLTLVQSVYTVIGSYHKST